MYPPTADSLVSLGDKRRRQDGEHIVIVPACQLLVRGLFTLRFRRYHQVSVWRYSRILPRRIALNRRRGVGVVNGRTCSVRLMRDIPQDFLLVDPKPSDLRQRRPGGVRRYVILIFTGVRVTPHKYS